MERVENLEICRECQGKCCKKCGCDYFVSDLKDDSIEGIEAILDSGRASIVATLGFSMLPNGKTIVTPILYLRSRNINRGAIDLLSFKTTCAALTESGCPDDLNKRPGGAAAVIPDKSHDCLSSVDKREEVLKWDYLQKKLARIVKRRTGKSVYQKLQEDAEALFYDVLMANFDGVSKVELKEIEELIPFLAEVYPEEFEKAKKRSNQGGVLRVLRNKNTI